MSNKNQRIDHCLNCGHSFSSGKENKFCPSCGQENKNRRIGIGTLILEFLGDFFTFDSKLFRSVKELSLNPGALTEAFNKGKRVRFIPPLRMYIFVSFIFFLLFRSCIPVKDPNAHFFIVNPTTTETAVDSFKLNSTLDFDLKGDKYDIDENVLIEFFDLTPGEEITEEMRDEYIESLDSREAINLAKSENRLTNFMINQLKDMVNVRTGELVNIFMTNISLAIFVAMPVFAFLLFLFFRKQSKFYIDHLIHSIHIHTWLFLMLFVFFLQLSYLSALVVLVSLLVYEYLSFVKVYKQGFVMSAVKTAAINFSYLVCLMLILAFLFLITLLQA